MICDFGWMNRNMLRRVELAWPVEDAVLRQRIIDECLVAYLQDDLDAWVMDAIGHYTRAQPNQPKRSTSRAKQSIQPAHAHGAQVALMGLYAAKT